MTQWLKAASLLLMLAVSCGGRAVDLNRAPDVAGGGSNGISDPAQHEVVSDQLGSFWLDGERVFWQTDKQELKSCVEANCQSTRIRYGTGYIGMAVGASDVFWIAPEPRNRILTCPKSGCVGPAREIVRDLDTLIGEIGADGEYLYWPSTFDLLRCPRAGCAATPEVVAIGEADANGLQFADDYVYWWGSVDQRSDAGPPRGGVKRAPKDGHAPPELVHEMNASPSIFGNSFAVDHEHLYWVDERSQIVSCALASCAQAEPTVVLANEEPKGNLRVDDTGVYWQTLEPHAGPIRHCFFGRCQTGDVTAISEELAYVYKLQGDFVYWTHTYVIEATTQITYPRTIQRIAKPKP